MYDEVSIVLGSSIETYLFMLLTLNANFFVCQIFITGSSFSSLLTSVSSREVRTENFSGSLEF